MPLFRFGQNWDPLGDLEREVDRMLRSVNMTLHGLRVGRPYPAVNLYERDDEYLLTAELPGTNREDLDVVYSGGILTLKGNRDDATGVEEHRFRRRERFHGQWQRSLSLPDRVDEAAISATFTDGILKVLLPKGAASPVRQITVTDGVSSGQVQPVENANSAGPPGGDPERDSPGRESKISHGGGHVG